MSNIKLIVEASDAKAQSKLGLRTKKETERLVATIISCIEEVLLENLDIEDFSMKLKSFGKFQVKHKQGIYRKIPFTGQTKLTDDKRKVKFTALGKLRQSEVKPAE